MNYVPPSDEKPDITDDVESSRAPLLEHLNELRSRLIKSLLALSVATIGCFFFAEDIYDLLVRPFATVAEEIRGSQLEFIFTAPMEYFFAQLKLAVFAGLFVAFPYLAFQVYAFVAPGLYKSERGAFWPYLVMAPVLFALGSLRLLPDAADARAVHRVDGACRSGRHDYPHDAARGRLSRRS